MGRLPVSRSVSAAGFPTGSRLPSWPQPGPLQLSYGRAGPSSGRPTTAGHRQSLQEGTLRPLRSTCEDTRYPAGSPRSGPGCTVPQGTRPAHSLSFSRQSGHLHSDLSSHSLAVPQCRWPTAVDRRSPGDIGKQAEASWQAATIHRGPQENASVRASPQAQQTFNLLPQNLAGCGMIPAWLFGCRERWRTMDTAPPAAPGTLRGTEIRQGRPLRPKSNQKRAQEEGIF
ncbi:hypothetical protein NDU88_004086 [Pleurodeles waltl]|uniref:Uncharacterized protein n=1 Tax=Pleurodeles waltl TaxID=8319 RepID=A0AAV7T8K9_PLEWA|nr:hypothetical protein NDU88_004086 [Pleurodeles waltl]